MTTKKPRILVLFCGGTISMSRDPNTGSLVPANSVDQVLSLEPRLKEWTDLEVVSITNLDSTDLGTTEWEDLVRAIETNYDAYDGFVVTVGTNTMAYAASALSFALQGIGKPVVCTGAQIPAETLYTDGRNNFVNAIRIAKHNLAGVFVVFGSKVILGCRAKKVSESDLDAFETFNDVDCGNLTIGLKFNKSLPTRHHRRFKAQNGFSPCVVCLTCLPSLDPRVIPLLIDAGTRGLILRSFGAGDLPAAYLPPLQYARDKGVPVIVTTQCRGTTIMGLNDPGRRALELGVIQTFDMSMEAMSTKMMWMLAQKIPYADFKKVFHENLAGEVDTRRINDFLNEKLAQLEDYRPSEDFTQF